MSVSGQSNTAGDRDDLFGDLKKNWGWIFALGLALVFLGTIGLGMTVFLTLVSVVYFGVLLVVGGVAQLVHAFKARGWQSIVPSILIAVLYVLSGLLIICNPVLASAPLTLLLAAAIIGIGVLRIAVAFHLRGFKNWIWPLAGGIIAVVIGGVIVAGRSVLGLRIIGLFAALEMIMNGCATFAIAFTAKNAEPGTGR